MAQVTVGIGGRSYRLACNPGEEAHLESLAHTLDRKIGEMRASFGEIGDQRLAIMAALTIADDASEAQRRQPPKRRAPTPPKRRRARRARRRNGWRTRSPRRSARWRESWKRSQARWKSAPAGRRWSSERPSPRPSARRRERAER